MNNAKTKSVLTNNEKESDKKIICPHCGSDNIQVQIVSETKRRGCLTILVYVFLALTVIGIPIMILYLLLRGKKTVNHKYYVCQNCGKSFNPLLTNSNNKKASIVGFLAVVILYAVILGLLFGSKDNDYVDINKYQQLDAQLLHNDYLDNEISAKEKYSNNYYYVSGEIYDIKEFLNDKYIILQYVSNRDKNNRIQIDAYFKSTKSLSTIKKGDKVIVYCKFKQRSIEDYYGITTYSLHSCRFKDEFQIK